MDDQNQNQTQKPADACINTEDGLAYWEGVSADENGMLGGIPSIGGFAYISKVDIQGSRSFLAKLGIGNKKGLRTVDSVLEGGAGIGRITKSLLAPLASQIDIIEPIKKFTDTISLPASSPSSPSATLRHIFNTGLESWTPQPAETKYDLIWTQWCVGHLTDAQLVLYLVRCSSSLSPDGGGGLIVIKENLSTSGEDAFDAEDSSVTRTDAKFQELFGRAGLDIVRMEMQRGFPVTATMRLLPVKMYALRPKTDG
ncbi:alpha-N-methyltransferase NTM1 [Echria macrotheca]|uniref:Alpha N-terminal protein methyltransferase 1 n=1 Tax=Echria macrotheca TaxID=438768 RepID=A0AAJ0BNI5_9PEZI|nr:alpha-N-methyltransferase NTM1 [Echria macrotheca]